MLVLTRRVGEDIVIASTIHVRLVAISGQRVRLGITAPLSVEVAREELLTDGAGRRSRSKASDQPTKTEDSAPCAAGSDVP
jgi:carbon storage regulator